MKNKFASKSAFFNPRVLCAFALCSVGALLGMFSLAATPLSELESSPNRKPVETTRANTSVPPDPVNFRTTFGSNANRLPPGLPLPPSGLDAPPGRKPSAQFSLNNSNRQGDPSSSSPTAGLGFKGMPSGLDAPPGRKPLRPGTARSANSPGNPVFANQQAAASQSMPLASGAQNAWSIVNSPNPIIMVGQAGQLDGVTCSSASECWAVGKYNNGSVDQTLIERWDGASWAMVRSPNAGAGSNFLSAMTCVSASDCWAVGLSMS